MHDDIERWAEERLRALGVPWSGAAELPQDAVVGIDGKGRSVDATRWADQVSRRVHLVAALGRPAARPVGATSAADDVALFTDKELAAALEVCAGMLEVAEPTKQLLPGPPRRELVKVAADTGAGLICVGFSGAGVLARALLGSVSEAVVHHSPHSVLLAREPPGSGPIVVAIGNDDGTSEAAAWGIGLAKAWQREVIFAHAVAKELTGPAYLADGPNALARTVAWPPKQGIAALAEEVDASLVIVGRGERSRWFGSTAFGILRCAPCSALVARPG